MTPTPDTAATLKATNEKRMQLQHQVYQIAHTMLDKIALVLDQVGRKPELPEPSVTIERRHVANCLDMYQFCPNARCRRRRCCLGEPVDCLRTGFRFVQVPQLERLLKARTRPKRRRQ